MQAVCDPQGTSRVVQLLQDARAVLMNQDSPQKGVGQFHPRRRRDINSQSAREFSADLKFENPRPAFVAWLNGHDVGRVLTDHVFEPQRRGPRAPGRNVPEGRRLFQPQSADASE